MSMAEIGAPARRMPEPPPVLGLGRALWGRAQFRLWRLAAAILLAVGSWQG